MSTANSRRSVVSADGITSSSTDEPFLRVAGLCHAYQGPAPIHQDSGGHGQVLRDASLELCRGEVVALLGRSGSGKSTLLNLISGIDRPERGSITLAGVELTGLGERERTLVRRRHIGFVYQFFNLIPTLTVRENVALALELSEGVAAAEDGRVEEMLGAVSLAHRADYFPDQISGGEQQRTAIARALIHQPALVLADEPTGNLDAHSSDQVLTLLLDLAVTHRAALLLVTHSREIAARAHRSLFLEEGGIRPLETLGGSDYALI